MISRFTDQFYRGMQVFCNVKAGLDLRSRRQHAVYSALRRRYYRDYWEEVAASLDAVVQDVGYDYLRIMKGKHWTFVRSYEVMLDNHLVLKMAGNKPLVNRILAENGFPVPRFVEYNRSSLSKALNFLKSVDCDLVVKPSSGGGGRGVTTKIADERQLRSASKSAFLFSKNLLAEEQIAGRSYRLLYLDGVFLEGVRRDPPSIIGDGQSSVRKLVSLENQKRLQGTEYLALSPLAADLEMRLKLKQQGLSLNDVPSLDETVIVKDVVNQNASRDNHIIPVNDFHASIVELGVHIAMIFDLKLLGLDIMCPDISVPLEDSGGAINEINTTPGLHHHDLVATQVEKYHIGKQILTHIFESSEICKLPHALNC